MPALSTKPGYQCCFCAQPIASDVIILTFAVEGGGTQELPCHPACLRRVVHPSVPLAVEINVQGESR
jgi:hypothetical protein